MGNHQQRVQMRRKLLSTAFIVLGASFCAFGGQKLAPELNGAELTSTAHVIITWRHNPGVIEHGKVAQHGGDVQRTYKHLKSAAYKVPVQSLQDLANDPEVAYIAPDRPVRSNLDNTAAAVNATSAWIAGYIGTGIGVAVIDSGMNANSDLAEERVVYSQDFTGQYKSGGNVAAMSNAPDTFGHGEHVAGIIAGNGKGSLCGKCTRALIGIAPGAKLVNLRVLDDNGNGTDSAVIAAIDQAIALKDTYNIRVINLSLGRPVFESYTQDPLCQAVEQAWKAGIVVVVAAGNNGRDNSFSNNGYGTITAPGNDPYVITVGAMKAMGTPTRTDDLVASYSSKGPSAIDYVVKPDIMAPGNQVVSLLASKSATLAKNYPQNVALRSYYMTGGGATPSPSYFNLSGTSMATPVVSAAAADLLQARPTLTPDQVKAILMATSYKTFPTSSTATDPASGQTFLSYYDPFTIGAGYLDMAAALASTQTPQGNALSPSATYDPTTQTMYFVFDSGSVWAPVGTSSIFSTGAVWGGNIDAQTSAWGQRINASTSAWGQRILSTTSAWGQRVLATTSAWGQRIRSTSSLLSALSAGVPGADPNVSAAGTPAAQATTVTVTGEQ